MSNAGWQLNDNGYLLPLYYSSGAVYEGKQLLIRQFARDETPYSPQIIYSNYYPLTFESWLDTPRSVRRT